MSSETMAWLAENYKLGIGLSSGLVILIYIVLSVLAIKHLYKVRGYILVRGTLPVIHVFFLFAKPKKKKVVVKKSDDKKEDESSDDDLLKDIF